MSRPATCCPRRLAICDELDLRGHRASARARCRRARTPKPAGGDRRSALPREGQFWTIAYGGETARLHDLKGLRYIAAPARAAGRDVHVLELAGRVGAPRRGRRRHDGSRSCLERSEPVLDQQAKDEYRRRLRRARRGA